MKEAEDIIFVSLYYCAKIVKITTFHKENNLMM